MVGNPDQDKPSAANSKPPAQGITAGISPDRNTGDPKGNADEGDAEENPPKYTFQKPSPEWVMVSFTAVIAFWAGLQWYEMHGSGKQADKLITAATKLADAARDQAQAAKDTANAAGKQVDAANRFADSAEGINRGVAGAVTQLKAAADNAKASIEATKEAMRLDQRAWLGASDYTYSIAESGPIDSSASVTNTGKTPALNILCKTSGTTKVKGYVLRDSDIVYPSEMPIVKEGTLFPNQHFPLKANATAMNSEKQKIWFDNVQSGDWIQYFFGEVRYKDAFGRDHWTHFCTQFVPGTKSGTPCPIYNETDDSQRQNPN